MYKKKQFSKLEKEYNKYQESGSVGLMMDISHKGLEIKNNTLGQKSNVLEIGAGTSPHLSYINHDYQKYFFLENSLYAINFLKKKFKSNKKIKYIFYKNNKLPFQKNYFDRIIMSHVLEHIPEPEKFLISVFKILRKNGYLSIALPNDPGLLWRIGRYFLKIYKVKKILNMDPKEYDYMIATEHINSIFNLLSMIRYNFSENIVEEKFLPFRLKSIDLNLFCIITLRKNN